MLSKIAFVDLISSDRNMQVNIIVGDNGLRTRPLQSIALSRLFVSPIYARDWLVYQARPFLALVYTTQVLGRV